MQDWNWDNNAWICSKDGREHHALANFCAVCGVAIESKPVDCMADIPSGESKDSAIGNLPVIMDQVDDLFNVFGQPLLVNKFSGKMSTYIENEPRVLPQLNGASLHQVDFDRWWIYALTEVGTLQVFPTSALLNDDMLQSASWKQIAVECGHIENIALGRDRLFLLDQEALTIHTYKVDEASCDRYWKKEERIFDELKMPYKNSSPIEEMIPVRGSEAYLGLIEEENRVAFLDLEQGKKTPYSGTLGDTLDAWAGVMRGEEPKEPSIWLLTKEGGLSALNLVGQQVIEDIPSQDEVWALQVLRIESGYWYMAMERNRMLLFDPLDRQVKSKLECSPGYFMVQIDKTKVLGGLVANFQKGGVGASTATQFYLSRLDERGGAHALRGWPLGEEPVAPPAGFGKYVYVLTRDHEYHLYRYDLLAV